MRSVEHYLKREVQTNHLLSEWLYDDGEPLKAIDKATTERKKIYLIGN